MGSGPATSSASSHERVEGFWFQPGAGDGHEHLTPEDAHGHVVPLLARNGA
jgi:hypothetical protein